MKNKYQTIVRVTAEDIATGRPNSACRCPVAHAIRKVIKPEAKVYVYLGGVEFQAPEANVLDRGIAGRLPATAHKFIRDFDNKQEVEPFEFLLDIPEELLKST